MLRALPASTVDEIDAAFDTIQAERILALASSSGRRQQHVRGIDASWAQSSECLLLRVEWTI
jgi:hypothetical protein